MTRDERQTTEAVFQAIGQNIQQHRTRTRKSFLDIELATRISAQSITHYEHGKAPIPLLDLIKLAQFFGISPAALLEGVPQLISTHTGTDYQAFSEAHTEEFQQNFLKVTGPNRGDKFRNFIKKLDSDDEPDGSTRH